MPSQHTISFNADGFQLVGTLHLPDRPNPPVVIGCHGLLANRHSTKQTALAAASIGKGLAYFRFDHRGCGDSQGDFSQVTSLDARRHDLYHAVQTLQHHSGVGYVCALFGSSFGGTVVLSYATDHPSPPLITYAAPVNSKDIFHGNIYKHNGHAPSSDLLTDAMAFDIASNLSSVSNILVCHCSDDETVPASHADLIFAKANNPKHKHIFPGGDHRMSDLDQQEEFQRLFLEWTGKTKEPL